MGSDYDRRCVMTDPNPIDPRRMPSEALPGHARALWNRAIRHERLETMHPSAFVVFSPENPWVPHYDACMREISDRYLMENPNR